MGLAGESRIELEVPPNSASVQMQGGTRTHERAYRAPINQRLRMAVSGAQREWRQKFAGFEPALTAKELPTAPLRVSVYGSIEGMASEDSCSAIELRPRVMGAAGLEPATNRLCAEVTPNSASMPCIRLLSARRGNGAGSSTGNRVCLFHHVPREARQDSNPHFPRPEIPTAPLRAFFRVWA